MRRLWLHRLPVGLLPFKFSGSGGSAKIAQVENIGLGFRV